jgi:callose synthase
MGIFDRYPSLRVAYIDEVEARSQDRNKKVEKVYYSALVKASVTKANEPGQSLDQVMKKCFVNSVFLG